MHRPPETMTTPFTKFEIDSLLISGGTQESRQAARIADASDHLAQSSLTCTTRKNYKKLRSKAAPYTGQIIGPNRWITPPNALPRPSSQLARQPPRKRFRAGTAQMSFPHNVDRQICSRPSIRRRIRRERASHGPCGLPARLRGRIAG